MNQEISLTEVRKSVMSSKNKKAVGIDNIPNEILKNETCINVLHRLFNACFQSGKIPSLWLQAIISPIPKSSSKDARVPLNYRGISLLSTLSKIYTSLLNIRLMKFLDKNNILADEQNGFRKDRSCIDHIFVLNSIIKNRMNQGRSTFAAFIDFKKAFDFVDRELLLLKLMDNGIHGNIYQSIKSLYHGTSACVRLNGQLTDWFDIYTISGVRQGDALSPSLFAIYVNDLLLELKSINGGINAGDENISCLAYADDIVIVANSPEKLNTLLRRLDEWCVQWALELNIEKSQIVHFRPKRVQRTNFEFKLNNEILKYVSNYKYLGVIFDEHLSYETAVNTL